MENTSYIGLSQLVSLRRELEVVAMNVANLNTTAYKAQQTLFNTYLNAPDEIGPQGDVEIRQVLDEATVRDMTQGRMIVTGNQLDIAIQGEGYMIVETPGGLRYTRKGNLTLDANRQLVTSEGLAILSANQQPIVIPEDAASIEINANGAVSTEFGPVDDIALVRFENEDRVMLLGNGMHATNQLPQPVDFAQTSVAQGMLEGSNVSAILEMKNMIDVSRSYERAQKILSDEHERQRDTNRSLARAQSN